MHRQTTLYPDTLGVLGEISNTVGNMPGDWGLYVPQWDPGAEKRSGAKAPRKKLKAFHCISSYY